ncbi:hypothetical protein O6H91_14G001100 [Diphasiastrum complanatum]|uniref:Uncharacterized protein n=1 Tax=Diphasiastrum complanatum TaxID=34168 RepID=A0ACC2BKT3_DIPCM|nr:hypothetical protein O6H91_14G001100 [Diphasiastrum complanatum]
MAQQQQPARTVCVTGGGGFIASWIIKLLLQRGYTVRATVRDPGDKKKNGFLASFESASQNLTLHKADLLDYDALSSAIMGCEGVFHVASPILARDEVGFLDPAIKGTLNVLRACHEAKVKRVILTSSVVTTIFDPNRPVDAIVDESYWSDIDYNRKHEQWYTLSKTLAEKAAWQFAKENELDLVTMLPALVFGPSLDSTINPSNSILYRLVTGVSLSEYNFSYGYVHVKDTAEAHILAYENPIASGRYLCVESVLYFTDLLEYLEKLFPNYTYNKRCFEEMTTSGFVPGKFSNQKVVNLGIRFTPLEQTLKETILDFKEHGFIN